MSTVPPEPPRKPTVDERIEAIAQSVELLSQMQKDSEKRYSQMFERLVTVSENLARIAANHETRIQGLEDKQ